MRSLQVKFSALVVALLLAACLGLAWIAIGHQRQALVAEVGERGAALAASLAGSAKEPLLAGDDLRLGTLVREIGAGEGVVAARIVTREGTVAASLDLDRVGQPAEPWVDGESGSRRLRAGRLLRAGAAMVYGDVPIGEAQVELDLERLVEPAVTATARQLAAVAVAVIALGVAAGLGFVALLVGPLSRLRSGVERLTAGDLSVRVPPTSRDEVGELTRAFNEMGESLQQKERIQSAFGRYVSDYVLTQLLQSPEGAELSGAEREVTVLFCDIRRFTRISEGMKPRDVVGMLNEVFQLASDRIQARGGTIDKFMGDSVMAYFGAPLPLTDHPLRAVAAALDILEALEQRKREAADLRMVRADVQLGVGIHTGPVVVGEIGSDQRTNFTAVGDSVNVAHRLEKLAEPGQILVSEAVQRRVRGVFRLRFEGERQLSGRLEPVHVYAVARPEASPPSPSS